MNDDEFGKNPGKLADFVASLGESYQNYKQTILSQDLYGAFLLKCVDDVGLFTDTLSQVGITKVRRLQRCTFLNCCRHFLTFTKNATTFPKIEMAC